MKEHGLIKETGGKIELLPKGYIASKVRGYDAITLAETLDSKVFDNITPEALAMVAASIANPAAPHDKTVNKNSAGGVMFANIQSNIDEVYNRLYIKVSRALHKLGSDINDFSSYDEMIKYIESIEKPEAEPEELNILLTELREKAEKAELIKSDTRYTQTQVVNALKAGEIVPSKALEECSENLEKFKNSLGGKNIREHIKNLQSEINLIDEEGTNGVQVLKRHTEIDNSTARRALIKPSQVKRRAGLEKEIAHAEEMEFLDSRLISELNKNHEFLKECKTLRREQKDAERQMIMLTAQDVLLSMAKGLKNIDNYQLEHDIINDNFRNYAQTNNCFKELVEARAGVYSSEEKSGVSHKTEEYNRTAAQNVYNWAVMNKINSDGMSNWKQLLKISPDMQEGIIYRQILQSADLLSQIGEMADAGFEKSDNETDKKYYAALKQTARTARKLLINNPVTV